MEKAILYAQDEIKEGKSAEDVAGSFTTRVAKSISKGRGQVKCGSAGNEAYSEFLRVDAGDSSAVSTGFNKLDLILGGGFRPGALYVLASSPWSREVCLCGTTRIWDCPSWIEGSVCIAGDGCGGMCRAVAFP